MLRPPDPYDLSWLLRDLGNAEGEARARAAAELGRLGFTASDALPALRKVAKDDPDDSVRAAARTAILNIRGYTSPPLDF